MTNQDPGSDIEEDFDNEEGEENAGDPIEAEIDEPPARLDATIPSPPPPVPAQAPRGRRKKIRDESRRSAQATPAAAVQPDPDKSREALRAWPRVLSEIKDKGFRPDDVMIEVSCVGLGPMPSNKIPLGTIDGSTVCGNDAVSSGDELVNFITNVYHVGRRGPARYDLRVYWKIGGRTCAWMDVTLADPSEIRAAQLRAEDWFRRRGPTSGSADPVGYGRPPMAAPVPAAPYPQQGFGAPMPTPGVDPMQQLREVASFYETLRQQAIASGMGAPPPIAAPVAAPAPPPAPPRLSPDEEEMLEEAKFQRRARSLGYVPASSIAAAPQPTAASVTAAANNPLDGIKGILKAIKEIDAMRGTIAETFGIETAESADPPELEKPLEPPFKLAQLPMVKVGAVGRPVFYPRDVEGGPIEFAQAFFAANPDTTVEMGLKFLQGMAKAVDQTSFGRVLEKLASTQGPGASVAAEAARVVQVRGVVGTGSVPSGLNGTAKSGPMA